MEHSPFLMIWHANRYLLSREGFWGEVTWGREEALWGGGGDIQGLDPYGGFPHVARRQAVTLALPASVQIPHSPYDW